MQESPGTYLPKDSFPPKKFYEHHYCNNSEFMLKMSTTSKSPYLLTNVGGNGKLSFVIIVFN